MKGMAKTLGLHFTEKWPNPGNVDPNDGNIGDAVVWMYVLGDMSVTNW